MAPATQATLLALEKSHASLESQLEQASAFASSSTSYHGREEWVLRWLLKKFQDVETRSFSPAWHLLRSLVEKVPGPNAARLLSDRGFTGILMSALEEAVAGMKTGMSSPKGAKIEEEVSDSSETARGSSSPTKTKLSRKRKRSGEQIVEVVTAHIQNLHSLTQAIHEIVVCITGLAKAGIRDGTDARGEAFAAEYMKAVVRTTNEEAARILGAWLVLCGYTNDKTSIVLELTPFIDIWASRTAGDEENSRTLFSTHCLLPSLALLSDESNKWHSQLEQLLARNTIIPTRISFQGSAAEKVSGFDADSISVSPLYGPLLFDVAIRCMKPKSGTRYRQQDNDWLQALFISLKDSIAKFGKWKTRNAAITELLVQCMKNHVILDLSLLRSITSQFGFHAKKHVALKLISTMISLDANVFLIPDTEENLLERLFTSITTASSKSNGPDITGGLVDEILVPLMAAFAKARNLTGFVHHWYDQLCRFELAAENADHFGAWDDNALRVELKETMKASLTTEQIVEIVDWLEEKPNSGPALVIADAIAYAMDIEDTPSTMALKLYNMCFPHDYANAVHAEDPKVRPNYGTYRQACLRYRIAANTIQYKLFAPKSSDDASEDDSWMETDFLLNQYITGGWLKASSNRSMSNSLCFLEAYRCACKIFNILPKAAALKATIGNTLLEATGVPANFFESVISALNLGTDVGEEIWGCRMTSQLPGAGWLACAYASCILVEYEDVLELLTMNMDGKRSWGGPIHSLVDNIFWIASATTEHSLTSSSHGWIRQGGNAFPQIWRAMLLSDHTENKKEVIDSIVSTMLKCDTHVENPIETSGACNGFAIRCLLGLPIEIFSKADRETIAKAWPAVSPDPSLNDAGALAYRMATLDPAVLSLKMKMMERPTLYEGIKFQDLFTLAEAIRSLCNKPKTPLAIFTELAKRTLDHVVGTIGQARSDKYVEDAMSTIKTWLEKTLTSKSVADFAIISLATVMYSQLPKDTLNYLETRLLFKDILLSNLTRILQKPAKVKTEEGERSMALLSIFDALQAFALTAEDLSDILTIAESCAASLAEKNPELADRIITFMTTYAPVTFTDPTSSLLHGSVSTVQGRQSIQAKSTAIAKQMSESQKLELLAQLLGEGCFNSEKLDKLLASRAFIISCEDNDECKSSLSAAYVTLAVRLSKCTGLRQFCLVSEWMELMLLTKPRIISQHNVETTLETITRVCSNIGPALPPTRAQTVFTHLCRLMSAILSTHRLKLQGRSHLLIQALQSLLTCLSSPLSSTASHVFPPWLNAGLPLGPQQASSFSRLLTLICDPSASSAQHSQSRSSNPLVSAPAKAKRMAGEFMPVILAAYVQIQLEASMTAEVRKALQPGIWAVLDTTTLEGRRALGEGMDANGRVILRGIVGEWDRFGRWKGA